MIKRIGSILFILFFVLTIIGCIENKDRVNLQLTAINACINQGGVPIIWGNGNLEKCQFKCDCDENRGK